MDTIFCNISIDTSTQAHRPAPHAHLSTAAGHHHQQPIAKIKWTLAEKVYLQQAASQAKPLKIMARALGRTPSAINKALNRFRLRPPRIVAITTTPSSHKMSPEKPLPVPPRPQRYSARHDHRRRRRITPGAHWLSLEGVLAWLTQNGLVIEPLTDKASVKQKLFMIREHRNKQVVTAAGLLMIANQKRREAELPLFHVPAITEN